jgi:alpha-ketoglutarate-dependent taurine dioxygenase
MTALRTTPLGDGLAFGIRVDGITLHIVKHEDVRRQILDIFDRHGVIVFENVEASTELQVEVSNIFGPLEEHPLASNKKVDGERLPGVIDMNIDPEDVSIIEYEGELLSGWTPWHFDSSYTKKLCRGAVLRPVVIAPEGGLTGFVDGIELYKAISPEMRARFEDLKIVYDPTLMLTNLRFGMPEKWGFVRLAQAQVGTLEGTKGMPRSVHPAIWQRESGERVLHVSAQTAAGIYGQENAEGEALLHALFKEIDAKMNPYWHQWKPTQMLVWDNWRFLHKAKGIDPKYHRRMHRTTIGGDYGLGYFEHELTGDKAIAAA